MLLLLYEPSGVTHLPGIFARILVIALVVMIFLAGGSKVKVELVELTPDSIEIIGGPKLKKLRQ